MGASKAAIIGQVALDAELREAIFERLLQSRWSPSYVAASVRWLLQSGFQASPAHCRKTALLLGSVTVLRILLVEARVDVCGLELLEAGIGASAKQSAALALGNSGWVQHSKQALKVLLARGAVLGNH